MNTTPRLLPRREGGFVLLAVLWVLVAMTIAATAFSVWVDQARGDASRLQTEINAELTAHSVMSAVTYARLAGRAGPRGVEWPSTGQANPQPVFQSLDDFLSGAAPAQAEQSDVGYLRLDDTVYGLGDLRFIVQDRGGYIGLTSPSNQYLFTSLAGTGVAAESLRDLLSDYQDTDKFRRLHGAEAPEYRLASRGVPADGALRTPLQLRDIIGWDQVLADRSDAELLSLFRVDGGTFVNVNTASLQALELLLGNTAGAEQLVRQRRPTPYTSALDVANVIGSGEDLFFGVQPEPGIRFWWWHDGADVAHVYDVQFAPLVSGRNAVNINWYSRVALTDELKQKHIEPVVHPLFETSPDYRGW